MNKHSIPRFLVVTALGLALALPIAVTAHAEQAMEGHSGHMMSTEAATADAAPSTTAYIAANAKMHQAMAIDFTGDADVDFVRGMIGHHQGAIDMAKIVLENGSDPEVRKLAQNVISAQTAEIDWMQKWLETHAPK
ncbi:CopM family metallochaperone [Rhodobacter capsulatus]|uniref:CopM family metallochaperone n=1 Tax=Rhodobacter capsulatus TaxID=1061 RepID=UPI004029051D